MRDPLRPRQLPLDLAHEVAHTRDDLVVSEANRDAAGLIDSWPHWSWPVVVLAGPAGSGKTHLSSIWQAASGATSLAASDIAGRMATLDFSKPILIDDADRGELDEQGLFHLINAVRGAGGALLLTARRFPSAWAVRLPDLASRLNAAATVEIREPDDILLAGVVTKLFADRQVEVDPQIVQFLVRRIERSLSTAIRVVDRLDRAALEQKSKVTRAMAAETVNAMDMGQAELDI